MKTSPQSLEQIVSYSQPSTYLIGSYFGGRWLGLSSFEIVLTLTVPVAAIDALQHFETE